MNAGMTWNRVDRFARSFHERATVHLLRGVLVVRTAEQADPVRSVEMRSREPVLVISVRDSVPEQILGLAELVTARATRGELKLERLLGERGNHGPAFIASRRQRGWRCERERERRLGQRTRHRSAERECG